MAAEVETRFAPDQLELGHREVRFAIPPVDLAALRVASADDLFLIVGEREAADHRRRALQQLRRCAHELPWASTLSSLRRLRPDAVWSAFTISASMLGRRNYTRYELEDHVAEGVEAALGLRYRATPAPMPDEPELSIRVHLAGGRATFALRVFDTPLHRRDYKHRSCVGTLHPPLAAAMALLAGLRANSRVLDPFAGVGTLAIEARRLQPAASVTAADIDEARIRDAATNARLASARVDLACADGAHMPWRDGAFDRVVSNVPWARAVRVRGGLARTPERREREIARVLDEAGRAVLLVDRDDPVGRGTRLGAPLALLHRSWVSVFGQHPRLCVVVRDGAGDGVIDAAAPCGPALERWLPRADTAEIRPSPSPEIGSLPATAALSSHRR